MLKKASEHFEKLVTLFGNARPLLAAIFFAGHAVKSFAIFVAAVWGV